MSAAAAPKNSTPTASTGPAASAPRRSCPCRAPRWTQLGWDSCDVIIVTGDAYVDHPSFGMAIMGRLLEAQGFRVGIIAQPDWQSAEPFKAVRQAEPVLRHHRRQHGFDGEPLHLGQAHPQRRRVHARRRGRQAAGSLRRRVRAARARSVQGRAHRHRRHRSLAAPHRALRLLEREGAPLACCWTPRRTCWCSATPSGRSSRSRIASPPAQNDHRDHRPARHRLRAQVATTSSRSTPLI